MTGKSFKTTIIILSSLFLSVVLALAAYAVINGYSVRYMYTKIFPGTVEGVYKPYKIVEIPLGENVISSGGGGYIYVINGDNLHIIDDRGNDIDDSIITYEEPGMSSYGEYTVIYDKNSGDYILYENGKISHVDSFERPVLSAVMQENGFIVFVLRGKDGFLGSAAIVSNGNELIAMANYSDRYPVSGGVTGNLNKFAVTGIYGNDTEKTGIDIYEMYNPVPIAGINRDVMLPLTLAMGQNSFLAAGDGQVKIFEWDGTELGSYEYNDIIRMVSSEDGCWLVAKGSGGDKIIFIDEKGKEKWTYGTGSRISGLAPGGGHVFYWSGRELSCLDEKGNPVDIQSGFDLILNTIYLSEGKIGVVAAGSLVFYEYK